jgi:hypothetical protein
MKKLYVLISIMMMSTSLLKAQILVENHFDGYIGTPATVEPGWTYSWNSDTTQTTLSYYTTNGCGISCPAYKFGLDSVYVTSPMFNNADTLRFMLKGNGTQVVENTLEVYSSPDGSIWNMEASFDTISAAATTIQVPLPSTAHYVGFLFRKPTLGYNAGVDDIYIYAGAFPVDVKTVDKFTASFRPNPVMSKMTIDFGTTLPSATVTVINIIGKQVMNQTMHLPASSYVMNLSSLDEGVYFVRVQSGKELITKRIVVKH